MRASVTFNWLQPHAGPVRLPHRDGLAILGFLWRHRTVIISRQKLPIAEATILDHIYRCQKPSLGIFGSLGV